MSDYNPIPKEWLIYLGSPYNHPDEDVRQKRFEEVIEAAAALFMDGSMVYTPIGHGHPIQQIMPESKDKLAWEFWQKFDERILKSCDCLVVLQIEGWDKSVGLKAEVVFAALNGIPVYAMIKSETGWHIESLEGAAYATI